MPFCTSAQNNSFSVSHALLKHHMNHAPSLLSFPDASTPTRSTQANAAGSSAKTSSSEASAEVIDSFSWPAKVMITRDVQFMSLRTACEYSSAAVATIEDKDEELLWIWAKSSRSEVRNRVPRLTRRSFVRLSRGDLISSAERLRSW